MGWTSIYSEQKPDAETRNRLADRDLSGPSIKILDRSGWFEWNHHRYTLCEYHHHDRPTDPPDVFIAVTLVEYRRGEIFWQTMEESEGLILYDCPVTMIHRANQSPTHNKLATEWRAQVTNQHEMKRQAKKFLEGLRRNFPNCDRRVVVDRGEAEYQPVTSRRKRVHVYQLPGDRTLYRLDPLRLNMEKTLELRATPQAS